MRKLYTSSSAGGGLCKLSSCAPPSDGTAHASICAVQAALRQANSRMLLHGTSPLKPPSTYAVPAAHIGRVSFRWLQLDKLKVHARAPVQPTEHPTSPFHELALDDLWDGIGRTRVRQHVNPLRRELQVRTPPPDWSSVYSDCQRPLVVDLGTGPGRFLLLLHKRQPDQGVNYLGIEIRRSLVERANEWARRLECNNHVHYLFCNATISLADILQSYPGPLQSVYIQFPDPTFKRRHRKRRMLQPPVVNAIKQLLQPGGQVFLQSDVEPVAVAMRNIFEMYALDVLSPTHDAVPVFYSSSSSSSSSSTATATTTTTPATATTTSLLSGCRDQRGAPATATAAHAHPPGTSSSGHRQLHECINNFHASHATKFGDSSSGSSGSKLPGGTAATAVDDPLASSATSSDDSNDCNEDADDGDERPADWGSDYDNMVSQWAEAGWLAVNPIGTPTEREHYVLQQGKPVYRVLLTKT